MLFLVTREKLFFYYTLKFRSQTDSVDAGLPEKVPGQGKVREFYFQSGKLEKMKKVMENSGNFKNFEKIAS